MAVPLYLLGSSDFSARLAAREGLPFAFASHFAPDYLRVALELYRASFAPSDQCPRPYVIVGVNVFAAPTDAEARRLFTTLQQTFLGMMRGVRSGLLPPVASMDGLWTEGEAAQIGRMTRVSVVGSPQTMRAQFRALLAETHADELMLTAHIYDHSARKRSIELAAQVLSGPLG